MYYIYLRNEEHNRLYLIRNRKQRNCEHLIDEVDIFMKCKCAACAPYYKQKWNNNDWKRKQKAFIGRDEPPKLKRAIHVVSLYQDEIIKIREAISNEKLLEFIKSRLKFSIYYKHIQFIEKLKSESIDNLNNFNELIKQKIKESS